MRLQQTHWGKSEHPDQAPNSRIYTPPPSPDWAAHRPLPLLCSAPFHLPPTLPKPSCWPNSAYLSSNAASLSWWSSPGQPCALFLCSGRPYGTFATALALCQPGPVLGLFSTVPIISGSYPTAAAVYNPIMHFTAVEQCPAATIDC